MTDMANNFYYCGKLTLKLLIFRLIIKYFVTLRTRSDYTIFNKKKTGPTSISIDLVENYGTKSGSLIVEF